MTQVVDNRQNVSYHSNMVRNISFRELQKSGGGCLDDLPVIITKYNKPVAILKTYPEESGTTSVIPSTDAPIDSMEDVKDLINELNSQEPKEGGGDDLFDEPIGKCFDSSCHKIAYEKGWVWNEVEGENVLVPLCPDCIGGRRDEPVD